MSNVTRRTRLAVVALLVMVTLAACVPGRRGWSCDSDTDCKEGLVCKQFGSLFNSHYCVSPGSTSIRSSETYGWVTLIVVDGFALFFASIILLVIGAVVWEKLAELWSRIRSGR